MGKLFARLLANQGCLVRILGRSVTRSRRTANDLAVLPGEYTVLALAHGWDIEWLNPSVLKPYLQHGNAVEVSPLGKYTVKVDVQ